MFSLDHLCVFSPLSLQWHIIITDFLGCCHVLLIVNVTYLFICDVFHMYHLLQNTFVGLTNLGATCYVNTFLQVWFHNLELRRSIYQCHNSRAEAHDTESGTTQHRIPCFVVLIVCQLWYLVCVDTPCTVFCFEQEQQRIQTPYSTNYCSYIFVIINKACSLK